MSTSAAGVEFARLSPSYRLRRPRDDMCAGNADLTLATC